MNAHSQSLSFESWLIGMMQHGWLTVEQDRGGDYYIKPLGDILDQAYEWHSSDYGPKQSIDFITDRLLDECQDNEVAFELRKLIQSEAGKSLRALFAMKRIEYFKSELIERSKSVPDGMDVRKERLENRRDAA